MADKESFQFEISLPVAGFFRDTGDYGEDKAEAFAKAGEADWHVRRAARGSLRDVLGPEAERIHIDRIEFEEFDSGNLSHANGLWRVVVTAESDLFQRFLTGWAGADASLADHVHSPPAQASI